MPEIDRLRSEWPIDNEPYEHATMAEAPMDVLQKAHESHAAGRLGDAEALVKKYLSSHSDDVSARLLLGVVYGKTGRDSQARDCFELVLKQVPNSFEALFWMSLLARRQKEFEEAIGYAKRAILVRPVDAFALNNLGLCHLDCNALEEAASCFRRAIRCAPNFAAIYHNLGTALYLMGQDMDAAKALDQALLLSPNSLESYLSLGQVLLSQTNPTEAIKCAERAILIAPDSAEAHLLMASALVEDTRTGEAEVHMKRAIELNPSDAKAHGLLGQRFQSLGQFSEANIHLRRSLELEPQQGFAYFAYVFNNKITESDRPLVDKMEEIVAQGNLDPRQMNFLYYGLGRAYESLGEYEGALKQFDQANRVARKLKFGDAVFDRRRYAEDFDWLMETFSKEYLQSPLVGVSDSRLPIVIVGMMRSGTTLCEQILSSHPAVSAAGEQRFWPYRRDLLFGKDRRTLKPNLLAEAGKKYVEHLHQIGDDASHVTDKMPANYEMVGAIHRALPNARIIHMRRNPLDTCISIYTTPNRVPIEFAYDRGNIVFAYEQYLGLMEHWRSVIPSDRLLEVDYEAVVEDREREGRRMLDFIGLDWDPSVLNHEANQRNVITPSLWQVRQPIYTSSIDRWKRYLPWLGEFGKFLP